MMLVISNVHAGRRFPSPDLEPQAASVRGYTFYVRVKHKLPLIHVYGHYECFCGCN